MSFRVDAVVIGSWIAASTALLAALSYKVPWTYCWFCGRRLIGREPHLCRRCRGEG